VTGVQTCALPISRKELPKDQRRVDDNQKRRSERSCREMGELIENQMASLRLALRNG